MAQQGKWNPVTRKVDRKSTLRYTWMEDLEMDLRPADDEGVLRMLEWDDDLRVVLDEGKLRSLRTRQHALRRLLSGKKYQIGLKKREDVGEEEWDAFMEKYGEPSILLVKNEHRMDYLSMKEARHRVYKDLSYTGNINKGGKSNDYAKNPKKKGRVARKKDGAWAGGPVNVLHTRV
jgi:hypothetical protein